MFRDLKQTAQKETAPKETIQLERLKDEAILSVTRNVRGHLNAGRVEEASRVLADALEIYPDDVILEGVAAAVVAAKRRQGGQSAPVPTPRAMPLQASIQGVQGRRGLPLIPVAGVLLVLVAGGVWELVRPRGSAPGYAYPGSSAAKPSVQLQSAPEQADISRLQTALASAIKEHSWDEARLWVSRLSELQPGDPKIREWIDQIDQGRAADRKLADLRVETQSAIRSKNWNEADLKISLLLAQVPGDPEALHWRGMVTEGRKEDHQYIESTIRSRQVNALRAAIPLLIQAKRWDEAQKQITDLQLAVPNDAEADAWQKALTIIRISELKQQAQNDTPVTPAVRSAPAPPASVPSSPVPSSSAPARNSTEVGEASADKIMAALRKPASAPAPVESAIPLPATLSMPSAAPVPRIIVPPVKPDSPLLSRLQPFTGHWTYSNPKAPKPRITNGFQFSAETVALDVYPDGAGTLDYQAKPGIWHVAETSVKFRFRLTSWDGQKFVGKSEDGEKVFSVALEPGQTKLNLVWHTLKNPSRMSEGQAPLTKSPQ